MKTSRKRGPAVIRIDMPGYELKRSFEEVGWEVFFRIFEERGLAFLHQDWTARGKLSLYNRLLSRKEAAQI